MFEVLEAKWRDLEHQLQSLGLSPEEIEEYRQKFYGFVSQFGEDIFSGDEQAGLSLHYQPTQPYQTRWGEPEEAQPDYGFGQIPPVELSPAQEAEAIGTQIGQEVAREQEEQGFLQDIWDITKRKAEESAEMTAGWARLAGMYDRPEEYGTFQKIMDAIGPFVGPISALTAPAEAVVERGAEAAGLDPKHAEIAGILGGGIALPLGAGAAAGKTGSKALQYLSWMMGEAPWKFAEKGVDLTKAFPKQKLDKLLDKDQLSALDELVDLYRFHGATAPSNVPSRLVPGMIENIPTPQIFREEIPLPKPAKPKISDEQWTDISELEPGTVVSEKELASKFGKDWRKQAPHEVQKVYDYIDKKGGNTKYPDLVDNLTTEELEALGEITKLYEGRHGIHPKEISREYLDAYMRHGRAIEKLEPLAKSQAKPVIEEALKPKPPKREYSPEIYKQRPPDMPIEEFNRQLDEMSPEEIEDLLRKTTPDVIDPLKQPVKEVKEVVPEQPIKPKGEYSHELRPEDFTEGTKFLVKKNATDWVEAKYVETMEEGPLKGRYKLEYKGGTQYIDPNDLGRYKDEVEVWRPTDDALEFAAETPEKAVAGVRKIPVEPVEDVTGRIPASEIIREAKRQGYTVKLADATQHPKLEKAFAFVWRNPETDAPEIIVSSELQKHPDTLEWLLGHEFGHVYDAAPEFIDTPTFVRTRGNLLGHIAADIGMKRSELVSEANKIFKNNEIVQEILNLNRTMGIKVRNDPTEYFADGLATLFKDPEAVKSVAPKFYDAIFEFMDKRPTVRDWYTEVVEDIKGGRLGERERQAQFAHFEAGLKARRDPEPTIIDELKGKTPIARVGNYLWRQFGEANEMIQRLWKSQEKLGSEYVERVKNTEADISTVFSHSAHVTSEQALMLRDMDRRVFSKSKELGYKAPKEFSKDFGRLMFLRRAAMEHIAMGDEFRAIGDIPTAKEAKEQLLRFKELLGEEKFRKMSDLAKEYDNIWHDVIVSRAKKSGAFSDELIKYMEENPFYASIKFVDILERTGGKSSVTGGTRSFLQSLFRKGSLNPGIANPAIETLLTGNRILTLASRRSAGKAVVDFLQSLETPLARKAITVKKKVRGREQILWGRPSEVDQIGGKWKHIEFLEKGKVQRWYVPEAIAEGFDELGSDFITGVKLTNKLSEPFRQMMVVKNPGWALMNLPRDLRDVMKKIMSEGPAGSVKQLAKILIKDGAVKEVDRFIRTGELSDDLRDMLKNRMLILGRRRYGANPTGIESALDRQMEKFVASEAVNRPVRRAFSAFAKLLEVPGNYSEIIPKLTAYKYLKEMHPNKSMEEIAHLVRTGGGTPDVYRRGKLSAVSNNIFLFSNAKKEGWRSSWEAFKRNPQNYLAKTITYDVAPKAIQAWAAHTIAKPFFDKISEYDKRNYNIIPIGTTEQGKAVYFRLPSDFTGEVFGALTWDLLGKDHKSVTNTLFEMFKDDIWDQMSPTTSPLFQVLKGAGQYISSERKHNPIDPYRDRPWIPTSIFNSEERMSARDLLNEMAQIFGKKGEDVFKEKDFQTLENVSVLKKDAYFLKKLIQESGGGWLLNFNTEDDNKIKTQLEKIFGIPIAGSMIERFIKVSDYGLTERYFEAAGEVKREKAARSAKIAELIKDYIRQHPVEKKFSRSEMTRLYYQGRRSGDIYRTYRLSDFLRRFQNEYTYLREAHGTIKKSASGDKDFQKILEIVLSGDY